MELYIFVLLAFPPEDLHFPSKNRDVLVGWTGNSELPRGVKMSVDWMSVSVDVSLVAD